MLGVQHLNHRELDEAPSGLEFPELAIDLGDFELNITRLVRAATGARTRRIAEARDKAADVLAGVELTLARLEHLHHRTPEGARADAAAAG
jgi:hypothetical protein